MSEQDLLRQCANEALVSLVLPMVHEAISQAASAIAYDLDIEQKQAENALKQQFVRYASKYPEYVLNLDICSIFAGYHPSMDYEAPYTPKDDNDDDDLSPYGAIAA